MVVSRSLGDRSDGDDGLIKAMLAVYVLIETRKLTDDGDGGGEDDCESLAVSLSHWVSACQCYYHHRLDSLPPLASVCVHLHLVMKYGQD
jgi:hypothetical protein